MNLSGWLRSHSRVLWEAKFYLAFLLVVYTVYHWYSSVAYFLDNLPNSHVAKRVVPLVHYLQGTNSVFEKPSQNLYGPMFSLIVHPIVWFSNFNFELFKLRMLYVSACALLIIVGAIYFYYRRTFQFIDLIIILSLVLNFHPLIYDFQTTMPEVWEVALILLGFISYKHGWFSLTGLLLAGAGLIKIYPLFLVCLFLLIERRVFWWGVLHVFIITLLGQLAYGNAMGFGYFAELLGRMKPTAEYPLVNYSVLAWDNISLKSMLIKVFVAFKSTPEGAIILPQWDVVGVANAIYLAVVAFVFVGGTVAYWKVRGIRDQNRLFWDDFVFSIGCLLPLLLGPHASFESLVLSLPAFILSLNYIQNVRSMSIFVTLGGYLLLTGIIIPYTLFMTLTQFNRVVLFFLPQVSSRHESEIYKFLGMPNLGLIFLATAWFSLMREKIRCTLVSGMGRALLRAVEKGNV